MLRINISVPTDPQYWGDGATDESAARWAQFHLDRLIAWAQAEYPEAAVDGDLSPHAIRGVTADSNGEEMRDIMASVERRSSETWAADADACERAYEIRLIRTRCNLTQVEFAELLGLHSNTVSCMERGEKAIGESVRLLAARIGEDHDRALAEHHLG